MNPSQWPHLSNPSGLWKDRLCSDPERFWGYRGEFVSGSSRSTVGWSARAQMGRRPSAAAWTLPTHWSRASRVGSTLGMQLFQAGFPEAGKQSYWLPNCVRLSHTTKGVLPLGSHLFYWMFPGKWEVLMFHESVFVSGNRLKFPNKSGKSLAVYPCWTHCVGRACCFCPCFRAHWSSRKAAI